MINVIFVTNLAFVMSYGCAILIRLTYFCLLVCCLFSPKTQRSIFRFRLIKALKLQCLWRVLKSQEIKSFCLMARSTEHAWTNQTSKLHVHVIIATHVIYLIPGRHNYRAWKVILTSFLSVYHCIFKSWKQIKQF